jgi:hypothetical protein
MPLKNIYQSSENSNFRTDILCALNEEEAGVFKIMNYLV